MGAEIIKTITVDPCGAMANHQSFPRAELHSVVHFLLMDSFEQNAHKSILSVMAAYKGFKGIVASN